MWELYTRDVRFINKITTIKMEKKIENLKKEILSVFELPIEMGKIEFICHQVEAAGCIEIKNWGKEIGLLSEIRICQGDDLSDKYAVINIRKKGIHNISATLFSKRFSREENANSCMIDEYSKILNELKLIKKSLIKRNAKAKIELLKSEQSETELWKEE
jgi:hypothetical protein